MVRALRQVEARGARGHGRIEGAAEIPVQGRIGQGQHEPDAAVLPRLGEKGVIDVACGRGIDADEGEGLGVARQGGQARLARLDLGGERPPPVVARGVVGLVEQIVVMRGHDAPLRGQDVGLEGMLGQALSQHGPQRGRLGVLGVGHQAPEQFGKPPARLGIEPRRQRLRLLAVAGEPALPQLLEKGLAGHDHLFALLGLGRLDHAPLHELGRKDFEFGRMELEMGLAPEQRPAHGRHGVHVGMLAHEPREPLRALLAHLALGELPQLQRVDGLGRGFAPGLAGGEDFQDLAAVPGPVVARPHPGQHARKRHLLLALGQRVQPQPPRGLLKHPGHLRLIALHVLHQTPRPGIPLQRHAMYIL